jgi:type VI secretion system secreted protein Hcp
MATNMFVQFSTKDERFLIEGECEDIHHEKWCEITSLDQDFTSKASPLAPAKKEGRGAVKCEHSEIKISKLVDKASTGLMEACWLGKTLDKVVIECFRAGKGRDDANQPIKYFSIELERVVIRDLEYSVGEGDLASEDIELVYAKATFKYRQMDKELGTAALAGAKSRTVGSGNWKA